MNIQKIKPLLKIVFVYGLLLLIFAALLPLLFREDFQQYIIDLGPFGPIAVIVYTIASHVLAPVTGAPAMITSFVIYGFAKTMLYEYIASIISSVISYHIARHYGRKVIRKLVGEQPLKDIDAFVAHSGLKVLIITRLFGITIFDIVSYASGIAKIPFKPYFFITITTNALLRIIYIIALRDLDFTTLRGLGTWFGLILVIGTVLTYLIRRYLLRDVAQVNEHKPNG